MGKAGKIAIGCGCLLALVVGAVIAVVGWGAYQAKAKLTQLGGGLEKAAARAEEIQTWTEKANEAPYTPPADGVLSEPRFLAFLEARKRVHAVYQGYEAELARLKAESDGRPPSISEALATGGRIAEVFAELRLSLVKALAELGMSEAEYRDIQVAVYKTAWTAAAQRESGKLPSEAVGEASRQAGEAFEKAMAEAAEQGAPGAEQMSAEQREQVRRSLAEAAGAIKAAEAPQANVELFRKHEAEIRKYAMSGLELLGF